MSATAPQLFDNIPSQDPLHFMGSKGKVDYKKVPEFFNFSKPEVSKIAGISQNSVRYESQRIPPKLKHLLVEMGMLVNFVALNFFAADLTKTEAWFHSKNPLLGYVSPRDTILFGQYEKLAQLVAEAKNDNPD